jgi:hypothetical protein
MKTDSQLNFRFGISIIAVEIFDKCIKQEGVAVNILIIVR